MEKKELFKKLNELKKKIANSKKELSKINKEKEADYHKKEKISKKISSTIMGISENKIRINLRKNIRLKMIPAKLKNK